MLLEVKQIEKSFEKSVPVVKNSSFTVRKNEIFALLGPSGCGKTTTLRLISGFEHVDKGEIYLNKNRISSESEHLAPQKRGIGFVFQDYALFPHMSALDNVAFGLSDLPKHKRHVFAEEVLCRTGMGDHKHKTPAELSGGQQQRVALARAIAPEPSLILLDEPFSNLDAMLRESTRKEVRSIIKKAGMTAVLVTHDQEEALSFADRIAVMNDGKIEQIGTPEEVYYTPKTKFVAQFLGRTNLLEIEGDSSDMVVTKLGNLKLNRCINGCVTCSIRPEHLTIEVPGNDSETLPRGIIIAREFKGHDITYHVECGGDRFVIHTDNRILFQKNDEVVVRSLEAAVVLDDM